MRCLRSHAAHTRFHAAIYSAVACASVVGGLVLVFRLVTPDSVDRLGTTELLFLLGLIVLPLVAFWARVADAQSAQRFEDADVRVHAKTDEPVHVLRERARVDARVADVVEVVAGDDAEVSVVREALPVGSRPRVTERPTPGRTAGGRRRRTRDTDEPARRTEAAELREHVPAPRVRG